MKKYFIVWLFRVATGPWKPWKSLEFWNGPWKPWKLKKLTVENLEKLFYCRVLFKFVVVDLRKNKDQEEGAIKV